MVRRRGLGLFAAMAMGISGVTASAAGDDLRLGRPVRHGVLEVYPVTAPKAQRTADYLLLEEGLKSGEVKIEERAGGGNVPELILQNRSRRPLLLVSGEVVYGGKQDRVIREDTVIPPLTQGVPLSVFCVEQGRWHGGRVFGRAGGFANLKVMKATNFKAQGDVWQAVAEEVAKARAKGDFAAATRTGTVQAVLSSKQAEQDAAPFLKAAMQILERSSLPIGFIVAIGGKPQAAHLFASPGLAYKLAPKLLRSYSLDAARSETKARPASQTEVQAFLKEAMKDRGRVVRETPAASTMEIDGALGKGKVTVDRKINRAVQRSYFAH